MGALVGSYIGKKWGKKEIRDIDEVGSLTLTLQFRVEDLGQLSDGDLTVSGLGQRCDADLVLMTGRP